MVIASVNALVPVTTEKTVFICPACVLLGSICLSSGVDYVGQQSDSAAFFLYSCNSFIFVMVDCGMVRSERGNNGAANVESKRPLIKLPPKGNLRENTWVATISCH